MAFDIKKINSEEKEKPQEIKRKEIKPNLEQYKDLEGITTKKLEFGLWFVENKKILRQAVIIFLIVIGAISWTYTIYGFTYYLAVGMRQDDNLIKQMVESGIINQNLNSKIAASPLNFSAPQVLSSGTGKFDIFSALENNNEKWWATFQYYFMADGVATEKAQAYIFPKENKFVMALAQALPAKPARVELKIENLFWHRINQHEIKDWNDYYQSRLNILTTDVKYYRPGQSDLSEKIALNQLNFTAVNNTAYNYWQVNFIIALSSGNSVVNINKYTLTDFMSGEKRLIDLSFPGSFGNVSKVLIIPEINIMDKDNYIQYEGGVGEIK